MNFSPFTPLRSLSTRLSLGSLTILLLAIWALAFFVSSSMQEEMRRSLEEQQFSNVSVLAAEIGQEMELRLTALAQAVAKITPDMMAQPEKMQAYLASLQLFNLIFNAESIVVDANGNAFAPKTLASGQAVNTFNVSDRDYFMVAMQGKAMIGKPVISRLTGHAVFVFSFPIRDTRGQVIGLLAGATDLGKSNFLNSIIEHAYGKTGGYVLISPQHKMIVAATDQRLVMQETTSKDPLVERFMLGYEGSGVFINPFGVETLSSVKAIPVAGWILMAGLPTAEAFAPIHLMQRRILFVTLLLSLLASGLIFWIIRHQLAPMLETTKTLARWSIDGVLPQTLPVSKSDEVGALIGCFNRLLQALAQREDTLRSSEKNLAITLASIGDAVIATDAEGNITRMNQTAERLTGCLLSDALGCPLAEVFRIINAQTRMVCANPVQLVMQHGKTVALANHTTLLARNGKEYQISDSAAPIRDVSGQIEGVVLVFSDVSVQYLAQEELHRTSEMLRQTGELAQVGGWELDLQTNKLSWTLETFRIVEISSQHAPAPDQAITLFAEEVRPVVAAAAQKTMETGEPYDLELPIITAKGKHKWVRTQGFAVTEDGKVTKLRGTFQDITERHQATEKLLATLREKTFLLNEVHHRVKNNLQVITSLLRLEAGRSDHAKTKTVLNEMQGRIRSMALLHETLYRSGIFASADLAHYLRELAIQAFRVQASGAAAIELKLDLTPVTVSMDQATPCGLLVNELISNCLKHGFPDGRFGEVVLALKLNEATHQAVLSVSDNGVGLPADFEAKREASLGLQLTSDLARQIGGALEVMPGPMFRIVFPVVAL